MLFLVDKNEDNSGILEIRALSFFKLARPPSLKDRHELE